MKVERRRTEFIGTGSGFINTSLHIVKSIAPYGEEQTIIHKHTVHLGKHASKKSELSLLYSNRMLLSFFRLLFQNFRHWISWPIENHATR
jgi:hypothetical protein